MLKNEEERRKFLDGYKDWPIWLTVPELGMRMFRADLPDGSCILVSEYLRDKESASRYGKLWGYPHYYLLQKGDAFSPETTAPTYMIEHLKNIKAEKGGGMQ